MATNNAINLKSSGIVSYDGAGAFSALTNPLTVSNGGLGSSSQTAYAVLCGGTTSTNPVQSIASVGSSTQVLKSNGAAALPTFQNPSGLGYTMYCSTLSGNSPDTLTTAQTTGFAFQGTNYPAFSGASSIRYYIPRAGTITRCYGVVTGTTGSNENITVNLRINDTTNATVTTTLALNVSPAAFNNTSMSQAVSAGDYFNIIFINPTFGTDPTNGFLSMTVCIT